MNKKEATYQKLVNKTALSHGSASSQQIGYEGTGLHSNGSKVANQKNNNNSSIGNAQKYSEDEGFMRGARIAEKI